MIAETEHERGLSGSGGGHINKPAPPTATARLRALKPVSNSLAWPATSTSIRHVGRNQPGRDAGTARRLTWPGNRRHHRSGKCGTVEMRYRPHHPPPCRRVDVVGQLLKIGSVALEGETVTADAVEVLPTACCDGPAPWIRL